MAGNFNINVSQTSDSVCLKLSGEFDGSSACELLNLLNDGKLSANSKILVDTELLKRIHPFGLKILHSRLQKKKMKEIPLVFTGQFSARFTSR
jgi:hypothetical protein